MNLIKTYQFKVKPNSSQKQIFEDWFNICRLVYNLALEQRIHAYKSNRLFIRKYDQYNELPALKREFKFISVVHSDVLQQQLDRLDSAYQKFYNNPKKVGLPSFRSKKKDNSFTFKRGVKVKGDRIKLPKIGEVRFHNSRTIEGEIKYTTIKKELDGYYINIQVEEASKNIPVSDNQVVGIDMGISKYAALSTGEFIENPLFLEESLRGLKKMQRKLSRQKRGSKSRAKTIKKFQKLHLYISRRRKDFIHKSSTLIVKKYKGVVVEDLDLTSMINSSKDLNRKMKDSSFGAFKSMLTYKAKLYQRSFQEVNPAYTSQTCSKCKHVDKNSRVTQSLFECTKCSHKENADTNAAKNIKARGTSFST